MCRLLPLLIAPHNSTNLPLPRCRDPWARVRLSPVTQVATLCTGRECPTPLVRAHMCSTHPTYPLQGYGLFAARWPKLPGLCLSCLGYIRWGSLSRHVLIGSPPSAHSADSRISTQLSWSLTCTPFFCRSARSAIGRSAHLHHLVDMPFWCIDTLAACHE